MIPAAIVEAAYRPEKVLLHLLLVHDRENRRRARAEEHADDDAREQERHDRNAPVAHGKRHGKPHGEHGSREGESRQRKDADSGDAERDGEHSSDGSAARYADDAGIGERVAEDALQHCTGDAQPRPHHEADERARQTDVPEHRLLLGRNRDIGKEWQTRRMGESCEHALHRDVVLP